MPRKGRITKDPKINRETLIKAIVARTGISKSQAKQGLQAALNRLKQGLREGKSIDFKGVGVLHTIEVSTKRRIVKGLRNEPAATIMQRNSHPKTVRMHKVKDLSWDPQPSRPIPAPVQRKSQLESMMEKYGMVRNVSVVPRWRTPWK